MRALGAKGTEVFSTKLTFWKQLATTFQYLGKAPNQHRDGFSLHNHCLCRVGAWSRTSHARLTPDVRNLTGMQQSSSFLFCSFFVCFLTKEEQRSARTCTRSWNWSAESKVYCRAGTALHCRSRLFARESSKYLLFVEAKVEWSTSKQTLSRDIVKVQLTWTQSGQTDPHAVTVLFLCPGYIQNVTWSEQIN